MPVLKNTKPTYFKLFGIAWIIVFIFVLAKIEALKTFGIMFFGGDTCASCTQVSLLSLGLCFLILGIGALSLAYGILLSESKPDLRVGRLLALTCAVATAGVVVFGWVNFAVNY